jgi:basic membrane lipoprotein Med (substrate-binding protein (PBP1-ABC) superfamily)
MVTDPQKCVLLFQEAISLSSWGQGGLRGVEKMRADWTKMQEENEWPPLDTFDIAENIAFNDIERTITQYHERGYRIFISYVGGWGTVINQVAPKFPDSNFFINYEEFKQPNITVYDFNAEETYFLAGLLGAYMSPKGVGFVDGFEIPFIVREPNGVFFGAKYKDPSIPVYGTFTQNWTNNDLAKEAALAMYRQGCTVVCADAPDVGVIAAAESEGKWVIPAFVDNYSRSPKTVLTSTRWDVAKLWQREFQKIFDGSGTGGNHVYSTLANGDLSLAPFYDHDSKVPQEAKDALAKAIDDIKFGRLVPPRVGDQKLWSEWNVKATT